MLENNQKEIILLKDLGMKFPKETSKKKARYGLYKCFCGNEFETQFHGVKNKSITSCGCSRVTHNKTKHSLYTVWHNMVRRCINKNHRGYKDYGGRGITVCDEWFDINNFIEDMLPSYQDGLSIDRKNNDLGYNKDNCRWVNKNTQARNTRKIMSTNVSGYRGVCWHKQRQKWRVAISINNKSIHIGLFDNPLDGALAYDNYIIKHNLEHTKNFS